MFITCMWQCKKKWVIWRWSNHKHVTIYKRKSPPLTGDFRPHGLLTTRNPTIWARMQARGILISPDSRPNRAYTKLDTEHAVSVREAHANGFSAAYISRCVRVSLGEVGLNSHHPSVAPGASQRWAKFCWAVPGEPHPRAGPRVPVDGWAGPSCMHILFLFCFSHILFHLLLYSCKTKVVVNAQNSFFSLSHYKKYVNLWPWLLVTEWSLFSICDLFVTKNRWSKADSRKLKLTTFSVRRS